MKLLEKLIKPKITIEVLNRRLHEEYPELLKGWTVVYLVDEYGPPSYPDLNSKVVMLRSPNDLLKMVHFPESVWKESKVGTILAVIAYEVKYKCN